MIRILIILSWLLVSIQLFAQKQLPKTDPANATVRLISANDTLQYALGSYLAQWVNGNGFIIDNASAFLRALDDVFRNQPRLIPDSITGNIVTNYQQIAKKEQARKAETFLFASLKEKPGIGVLPNGVYYLMFSNGEGMHPSKSDTVILNIKGSTANGIEFEDTYQKKQPVSITVSEMIPGVASVLPMMGVGSKWQLFIPSALAYGEKSTAIIPANSALIVELELLDVRPFKK